MAREDLIEYIDNSVQWMLAARKEHPELIFAARVYAWLVNRLIPRAVDLAARAVNGAYARHYATIAALS